MAEADPAPSPRPGASPRPFELHDGRRLPAETWGLLPILLVALTASGLLWGTGHELPFGGAWDATKGETDMREAVAWLAGVTAALLIAFPLLHLAARVMRGHWRRPRVLVARGCRRQELRRARRRAEAERAMPPLVARAFLADLSQRLVAALPPEARAKPVGDRGPLAAVLVAELDDMAERVLGTLSAGPEMQDGRWHKLAGQVLDELGSRLDAITPGEVMRDLHVATDKVWTSLPQDWAPRTIDPGFAVRLRYPTARPLRPTALGNVHAALEDRVSERYGIDLPVLWPRIAGLLAEGDRERVAAAAGRADAAAFGAAGWAMAAIGAIVAAVGYHDASWVLVVVAVGAVWLGLGAYVRAMDRAIAHGQLVEAAADLYRLPLLDAVGWRRPLGDEDERTLFRALSDALGGSAPTGEYRSLTAGAPADEMLARVRSTIDVAVKELSPAVQRTVSDSVSRELEGLGPAIDSTLRGQIQGPRLVSFNGFVAVEIRDGGTGPLPTDEEGRVPVAPHESHELVVMIGRGEPRGQHSAALWIRGGENASVVPFVIELESNAPQLCVTEHPLPVRQDGPREVARFAIEPGVVARDGTTWVWVRVMQQGRTIQNLEINAVPKEAAA